MTTISFRPADGQVAGTLADTAFDDVDLVVDRAVAAAPVVARSTPAQRRRWLGAVADALDRHGDDLAAVGDLETALGMDRLTGEAARAAAQLRFYGEVAAEGSYLAATLDHATATTPRIVRVNQPLGPVAVFGASNFPFAFGVLGNDTASALAAGCPVIVKAHPAHALTCLRLAAIAHEALADVRAPEGTFGMVVGFDAGVALVRHPGIRAVGFTGSQAGGLALWRAANERAEVIPVYAEMGTVNPVAVTPAGVARLDEIARGFVASFTLGSGQFCTKPGVLFVPAGHDAGATVAGVLTRAGGAHTMLTEGIANSIADAVDQLVDAGAAIVGSVPGTRTGWSADAVVLSAPIGSVVDGSRLLEECFGPVAVVIEYHDMAELVEALGRLQGSLAGTVFGGGPDDPDVARLVSVLAGQVGRVTVDDWPTGVAWTWAQHHGGPWPATSAPSATSVGAAALNRFVRPVAFQTVPDGALPPAAQAAAAIDNPWRIPRRIDGVLTTP